MWVHAESQLSEKALLIWNGFSEAHPHLLIIQGLFMSACNFLETYPYLLKQQYLF